MPRGSIRSGVGGGESPEAFAYAKSLWYARYSCACSCVNSELISAQQNRRYTVDSADKED